MRYYATFWPHFSQYAAIALLFEPQKMQNLLPSKLVLSDCELLDSEAAGDSTDRRFGGLRTDQTARVIETTIANMIIMNKIGSFATKLTDNGITG
jgi:hypothetical protein